MRLFHLQTVQFFISCPRTLSEPVSPVQCQLSPVTKIFTECWRFNLSGWKRSPTVLMRESLEWCSHVSGLMSASCQAVQTTTGTCPQPSPHYLRKRSIPPQTSQTRGQEGRKHQDKHCGVECVCCSVLWPGLEPFYSIWRGSFNRLLLC